MRQLERDADQAVHLLQVPGHPLHEVRIHLLGQHLDGDAKARERGAQVVTDPRQQGRAVGEQFAHLEGHPVELPDQRHQLRRSLLGQPLGLQPFSETLHGCREPLQGPADPAGKGHRRHQHETGARGEHADQCGRDVRPGPVLGKPHPNTTRGLIHLEPVPAPPVLGGAHPQGRGRPGTGLHGRLHEGRKGPVSRALEQRDGCVRNRHVVAPQDLGRVVLPVRRRQRRPGAPGQQQEGGEVLRSLPSDGHLDVMDDRGECEEREIEKRDHQSDRGLAEQGPGHPPHRASPSGANRYPCPHTVRM